MLQFGVIQATSQLSRFHVDCVEHTSPDVDLFGVSLTVNDADLLQDAHLQLKQGCRYGLIGRNGVGKSSLLKAIGERILIGFPHNISVAYVQQEVVGDERTVLQTVVEANAQKMELEADIDELERNLSNPNVLVDSVHRILTKKADQDADFSGKLAAKRSRLRGKIAREKHLELVHAADDVRYSSVDPQEAADLANDLLTDMYEQLAEADVDTDEPRAVSILTGLGFSPEQQAMPTQQLSGGWRMRAALAVGLFLDPELLLLDEPTNHLDMKSIVWLQHYLQESTRTLLIVSHDRNFLNAVTEETIVLRDLTLTYFSGPYDAFVSAREAAALSKARQAEHIAKATQKAKDTIAKATKAARESGDDKKLGLAASRRKKLDRMGPDKTVDGKKFKLSYQGYSGAMKRPPVVLDKPEEKVSMSFPEPEPLRYHGPLLQLRECSAKYRSQQEPVLRSVTMDLSERCRLGLLGRNGAGKTTLLGLLAGTLAPSSGSREVHPALRVGYFQQHLIDDLAARDGSALDAMRSMRPLAREQELYDYLGSFALAGHIARQPLKTLSGGQKCRAALALLMANPPHVLLLDEPTNHLDHAAIGALEDAIKSFPGAVVVVSHDVRFVSSTCEVLYRVAKGQATRYEGTVEDYVAMLTRSLHRHQQGK